MNIVVIGTGYVGLISGICYAGLGHKVACVDTNTEKISRLDLGEAPFYEPGLADILKSLVEGGEIVFTSNLQDVISSAEIVMLCVGTPSDRTGGADLSFLFAAAESIGECLDHEILVVTKSTVPVGTNRLVLSKIKEKMVEAGRDDLTDLINIASLPEFLREGSAIDDFMNPERIVIGANDQVSHQTLDHLHQGVQAPRLHMSIESAELTKYAANAFLATKISFINEIANIAEITGADVRDVAKAIGMDKRIGHLFLQPGIGYGGSCFPKDVAALHQQAGEKRYQSKILSAVIDVNETQRDRFVSRVESIIGSVKGRRLGVLGLAFKAGTDDVRKSAAIDIVQKLFAKGAEIQVFDPKAIENAKELLSEHIIFAPTAIDAADQVDALLVLTDWPEFREISFPTLKSKMVEPIIIDGRNHLADLSLEKYGFKYFGVGF